MKTKFKKTRKSKGFTAKELSKVTGVSLLTIQSYDRGIRDIHKANVKTVIELTHALDCNITDILEDEVLIQKLEKTLKK